MAIDLRFVIDDHKPADFTQAYKTLLDNYDKSNKCPALLLLDDVDPMIIVGEPNYYAIILDRNSKTLLRDLEQLLTKNAKPVLVYNPASLSGFCNQTFAYEVWYKWLIRIADYLRVDAPALFIPETLALVTDEKTAVGTAFPGTAVPYATDVFVKERDSGFALKTLVHEMRHVWQHKYNIGIFEGYQASVDALGDMYSLQAAEVDAEAFAIWTLLKNGIKYPAASYSVEVRRALRQRRRELEVEPPLLLGIPGNRRHG